MINKKTLGLAIVLSTLSSGDILASKNDDNSVSQTSAMSVANKNNENLANILNYIDFKDFQNPEELIAFYRRQISETNNQLSVYKKMRKIFDKTLLDIIDLNNKYKTNNNSYFYELDCVLTKEDKDDGVSSVLINLSLEKDPNDEKIYIPKLTLLKNYKNNIYLTFTLRPELLVARDRRAYAGNDDRNKYQVLLVNFVFDAYSQQNMDKKKSVIIDDYSNMKEYIKEFQERISSLALKKKLEKKEKKKLEKKALKKIKEKIILPQENNLDKSQEEEVDLNTVIKAKEKNSNKSRKFLETMIKISKNNRETLRELLRANGEVLKSGRDKNRQAIQEVFDLNQKSKNIKKYNNIISDEDIENIKDLEKF